jgi:hypothetical protein
MPSAIFRSASVTKVDGAGGDCGTVVSIYNFLSTPRIWCTSANDEFTASIVIGCTHNPQYRAQNASSILNVTTNIAFHALEWATSGSSPGTFNLTNNFGLKVENLHRATNNFAVHSSINGDPNHYFLYNAGTAKSFMGGDLVATKFGTDEDAKVYYDGADFIIDPDAVGTGQCLIGATGDDDLRMGRISYKPSALTPLLAADGITAVTNSIMRVQGATGPVIITANPQIAFPGAAYDGMILIVHGTAAGSTVEFNDGNGLDLSGQIILGFNDSLTLMYDHGQSLWIETSRTITI